VAATLEDLVGLWVTINEPNVYATLAYLTGAFPPGVNSLARVGTVLENMVGAHAAAYHLLHQIDPGCLVGLAHHYRGFEPLRPANPLDAWAARLRQATFNDLLPKALLDGRVRFLPASGARRSRHQDFLGELLHHGMGELDPRRWSELFGRSCYRREQISAPPATWPTIPRACGGPCNGRDPTGSPST
jgi:beta-glucosidase